MKKLLILLAATIMCLALVLAVSNPSDTKLRGEAEAHAFAVLKSRMPGQAFQHREVEEMARRAVEQGIQIENKYLFKEVRFTFRGETRVVGHGYLNSFHPKLAS